MTTQGLSACLCLASLIGLTAGCSGGVGGDAGSRTSETSATGDGDGDGDPASGDGDGEPTGDGDGDPSGDGDGDPSGDGDGDPSGDGDGDGCVPTAEICDGLDQDCDGVADNGVANDGAGCQDPGPPPNPARLDEINVTVHTKDLEFAGTDDPVEVCFPGIGLCSGLGVPDWNDRERGRWDVDPIPANGVDAAMLDGMTISISGTDRWEPEGYEVVADGVPVYCRDNLDVLMGTEGGGEVALWQDPEGFAMHCQTVWPEVLTHGPMLGSVGPDSVELWYRTDATRQTLLRVAASEAALADAPVVDYGYPHYQDDFTETVAVGGLEPDTTYFYALEIEGQSFGPWSFKTAPAPGAAATWRFAFGSCAGDDDQPIWSIVRVYGPDVFWFLGDNHYANSADIGGLRQNYRWMRERPDRAALLAEASVLATWDDHDYTGNNTDGTAPGKDVALEAFREYWANPSYGTEQTPGVFTRYSYGDVDFISIDDRYYRGLDDSITGDAQEQWLLDALGASTATFKFVVSGSQFTLEGSGDSWAVFPDAQARLLDHIAAAGITGVVFLSGDIHRSELRLVTPSVGGYPVPELTSSPMARGSSACGDIDDSDELFECVTGSDYFIGVEVDTTALDPSLSVEIFDVDGGEVADWIILASMLE